MCVIYYTLPTWYFRYPKCEAARISAALDEKAAALSYYFCRKKLHDLKDTPYSNDLHVLRYHKCNHIYGVIIIFQMGLCALIMNTHVYIYLSIVLY